MLAKAGYLRPSLSTSAHNPYCRASDPYWEPAESSVAMQVQDASQDPL